MHLVLGRPGIFFNTAGDREILPRVLDAASRFSAAPTDGEMAQLATERAMEPLFV